MTFTMTEALDVGRLVEPCKPSRVVAAAPRVVNSNVVVMGEGQLPDRLFYLTVAPGTNMLNMRIRVDVDAESFHQTYK